MLSSLRARLRRAPGVPQARHVAERAVAPYVRADLHSLHQDFLVAADRQHELDAHLRRMSEALDDIERHQPAVLNAISSVNGTTRLLRRELTDVRAAMEDTGNRFQERLDASNARQDASDQRLAAMAPVADLHALQTAVQGHAETQRWLVGRVETIRSEMMFELRYGKAGSGDGAVAAEAEIVTPGVLDGDDVRLNLGCGHLPIDGYANVDMRKLPGVDVVSQLDELPVEPGSVAEIFSAHVLEHFAEEQLSRSLLPYWRSLLRPGGTFRAVTPDLGSMIDGYVKGEIAYAQLHSATFGGQEYEGDFHFTGFTTDTMVRLLENAGFSDVEIVDFGRVNGDCLELEVRAVRPTD